MQIVENAEINQRIKTLLDRIPQEVNRMVAQLKTSLMNPVSRPEAKRGLWDRFKNTMSNLWWGRQNQDNPYFWKNKLGDDLGHAEHTVPVEEYRLLRNHCKILEEQLDLLLEADNVENLAMMKIINQWGEQLKNLLVQIVKDYTGVGPATASTTVPPRSNVKEPAVDREISSRKEALREKLNNLAGAINNGDVYTKIRQHIDKDELREAEAELSKYESGSVAPVSQEISDKKISTLEILEKALTKGLPQNKYNLYKKMISDTNDAEILNHITDELNRTATMDAVTAHQDNSDENEHDDDKEAENDDPSGNVILSFHDRKPGTGEKTWEKLSFGEKMAWDNYGGGQAEVIDRGELKGLSLPWVLRLDDPRLDILKSRRNHIMKRLVFQKRIEISSDPVTSRSDLKARIEEAKRLKEIWDTNERQHKKRRSQEEILANQLASSDTTKTQPESTPTDQSDPVTRTAEISHPSEPEITNHSGRVVDMPPESMPPNLPDEQEEGGNGRTHTLEDDNVDNDTAFQKIHQAKENNEIDEDQYNELIDLVSNDDTYGAMRLLRKFTSKEEEAVDVNFDDWVWVAPTGLFKEKVEYYKEMLRKR